MARCIAVVTDMRNATFHKISPLRRCGQAAMEGEDLCEHHSHNPLVWQAIAAALRPDWEERVAAALRAAGADQRRSAPRKAPAPAAREEAAAPPAPAPVADEPLPTPPSVEPAPAVVEPPRPILPSREEARALLRQLSPSGPASPAPWGHRGPGRAAVRSLRGRPE